VSGTGTSYSSVWVGIDGYNSSSVEQTVIEADVVNGIARYSAWYEMFPSAPVTVNLAIHPGDTISASVNYSAATHAFTLTVTDLTDLAHSLPYTFSISRSAPSAQRSSAEWIVEAPSSARGVLPLANFGSVTFTSAAATVNGTSGQLGTWANSAVAINMASGGVTEASTSGLTAVPGGTTGFTVTDVTAVPPPTTPPPVPPQPAPAPGSVATTTTLTGEVVPSAGFPTIALTVTVSPSVPVGSTVALLSGSTVKKGRLR
jgi:hypothetical protein